MANNINTFRELFRYKILLFGGGTQMKRNKTTFKKKKSLAAQYLDIVRIPRPFVAQEETLQQPHIHKFVDSVTTYGAYEKPI